MNAYNSKEKNQNAIFDANFPIIAKRKYRRDMKKKKRELLKRTNSYGGYKPKNRWLDHKIVNGVRVEYVQHSHNSKAKQYYKRNSNKAVRRMKGNFKGRRYSRIYDYWWNLY